MPECPLQHQQVWMSISDTPLQVLTWPQLTPPSGDLGLLPTPVRPPTVPRPAALTF